MQSAISILQILIKDRHENFSTFVQNDANDIVCITSLFYMDLSLMNAQNYPILKKSLSFPFLC